MVDRDRAGAVVEIMREHVRQLNATPAGGALDGSGGGRLTTPADPTMPRRPQTVRFVPHRHSLSVVLISGINASVNR